MLIEIYTPVNKWILNYIYSILLVNGDKTENGTKMKVISNYYFVHFTNISGIIINFSIQGSMMDYGVPKYGKKFVEDVKAVLNVAYMFLPFPLFWALFDQQGSRWTFQARHMNGDISFTTVLPDQIQVANPIMILAFIPLFEYGVYPAFNKFGLLKTPLQKIVTGGFLAAVAFFISGGLDLVLEVNMFKNMSFKEI